MSVLKFELKEEHVKLIKQLRWSFNSENQIVALGHDGVENLPPFGEDDLYEAIDLILNGFDKDMDPFTVEGPKTFSDEQKAEWDKLYEELPTAIDIVLYNGSYELGKYKTKYNLREWKKLK
jgi:hypothetical protein